MAEGLVHPGDGGCIQLADSLANRAHGHGEEFVNHHLQGLAQSVCAAGFEVDAHQVGVNQGAGDRAEGDAGVAIEPLVGLHHQGRPWLS